MNHSHNQATAMLSRCPAQAVPTDPAALWDVSKPILFIKAANVLLALRQRGRKTPGSGNRFARSLPKMGA
jgi:hypothetical protein